MQAFTEIPDLWHVAHVAPDRSGYLMVDLHRRTRRGKVLAKAYGERPVITTAAKAIQSGMNVLGTVVGTYPNPSTEYA